MKPLPAAPVPQQHFQKNHKLTEVNGLALLFLVFFLLKGQVMTAVNDIF
jgi:hypothetical protein